MLKQRRVTKFVIFPPPWQGLLQVWCCHGGEGPGRISLPGEESSRHRSLPSRRHVSRHGVVPQRAQPPETEAAPKGIRQRRRSQRRGCPDWRSVRRWKRGWRQHAPAWAGHGNFIPARSSILWVWQRCAGGAADDGLPWHGPGSQW